MKLLRAEFSNFRLLRDLVIDFSDDTEKSLTVIRAENETGKTTILTALQWALYGDDALPGKGRDFRLHPLDWDQNESTRVPVTATVDFEIPRYGRNRGVMRHSYRILRTTFEELDGVEWKRSASSVQLYRLTDRGSEPIDLPDSFIADELPLELREVFFTDGDRALSFIDADIAQTTKRDRVKQAIRSLLGLGVLEESERHVKLSSLEINRKAKDIGDSDDLHKIAASIERAGADLEELEQKYGDAEKQFDAFELRVIDLDRKITEALKAGDKEVLTQDIEKAKKEIKLIDQRIENAEKEHAALFKDKSLACDLLKPVFKLAADKLDELHDQGKIPNTTIPVLEDRLAANVCICGESLASEDTQGAKRRNFIQKSIEDSRQSDQNRKVVTELYYSSKELLKTANENESVWIPKYATVVGNRDDLENLRKQAGTKLKGLERKVDSLPDTDIKGLREARRQFQDQRDRSMQEVSTYEVQIANLKREIERLKIDRDKLLRDQQKGARILADLQVNQDLLGVLRTAMARITNEEVAKVSQLMNDIFIEMIGADPEQGSIIRKAEISRDFDIVVYGPEGKTLNTGSDLNGASRRALTLAFILALTEVSEVEAPNVVDTPLGMMSGLVKRSVLRQSIAQSSQLVLFLTRSEIAGCEDILDEKAGRVITLTNPAHYPKILLNDPGVKERKVIRCDCSHNESCKLCDRRLDADVKSEYEEAM